MTPGVLVSLLLAASVPAPTEVTIMDLVEEKLYHIFVGVYSAFFVVVVVVVFAVECDPQINNSQNLQTVLSTKQVAVTIAIT